MPIKYNLTKFDILAIEFHDLLQKRTTPFSKTEEISKAAATIVASFASTHSWQTSSAIKERNSNKLNSPVVKNEFVLASRDGWKRVKNIDIQEVSCSRISDSIFYAWRSFNIPKDYHEIYAFGWQMLKKVFNEECDEISSIQRKAA